MHKITNSVESLIQLFRPLNCLITALTVGIAYFLCGGSEINLTFFLALFSSALTAAAGNVINDILDVATDRINKPKRPIPAGRVSIRSAKITYLSLLAVSLSLAFIISNIAGLLVFTTHVLLAWYSYRLKGTPLIGNILIGFLTGLAFFYGGVIGGEPYIALIPAVIAGSINIIREIVKDMEDVEGDKAAGVNTYAIKYGTHTSMIIVLGMSSLFAFLSVFPFLTGIFNIYYLLIIALIIIPLLVYYLRKLIIDFSSSNLAVMSGVLKLIMVIGAFAIYAGR